jgi:hypothetical protein
MHSMTDNTDSEGINPVSTKEGFQDYPYPDRINKDNTGANKRHY